MWVRQSLGGRTLRSREPGRGPGDSQMERRLLPGASRAEPAEPASCRGLSPAQAPGRPGPACLQSGGGICPLEVLPRACCAAHTRPCLAGGERGEQRVCGVPWPVSSASLSPTCLSSRCSALLDPRGSDPPESALHAHSGLLSAACSRRCLLSNYYMRVLGAGRERIGTQSWGHMCPSLGLLILLMAGVRRNPRPERTAGAAQPSRLPPPAFPALAAAGT